VKDDQGRALSHLAVRSNNVMILAKLFEKGCNINEKDFFGNSPLHVAIQERYTSAALALIDLGADINNQDQNMNSALHLAVIHEDYRVVRRLLAFNARQDLQNDEKLLAKDLETTKEIKQLV
jgi:ankyrin repeat protein